MREVRSRVKLSLDCCWLLILSVYDGSLPNVYLGNATTVAGETLVQGARMGLMIGGGVKMGTYQDYSSKVSR